MIYRKSLMFIHLSDNLHGNSTWQYYCAEFPSKISSIVKTVFRIIMKGNDVVTFCFVSSKNSKLVIRKWMCKNEFHNIKR